MIYVFKKLVLWSNNVCKIRNSPGEKLEVQNDIEILYVREKASTLPDTESCPRTLFHIYQRVLLSMMGNAVGTHLL